MFSSLTVRDFRIYWIGMFVSLIGSWIQTVAQSWLVFQLTNSSFLLGMVGFLGALPVFILSLWGGVVADRLNKRTILIFTQTAFMFLAFLLAVLTQFNRITPQQIMFIAVFNGIVMAFDAPSRQSVVIELVGRQHLMNAIALNSISFNSSRIIGPAMAGILISLVGMGGCFYINGLSFLAVIIALFLIRIRIFAPAQSRRSGFEDLKEGLIFVKDNPLILTLVTMVGISSLFGISYMILLPVFAKDILHTQAKGLGFLMSASGCGAVAAGLILARLGDFKNKGRLLLVSVFVFSVSLIVFSLTKTFAGSLIIMVLLGSSSVMAMALINTLLQTKVSDEFRGRVMSVFMFTFAGFMPFGNLLAGCLAQAVGVSLAMLVSGGLCTVLFSIIALCYKGIVEI